MSCISVEVFYVSVCVDCMEVELGNTSILNGSSN